MIKLAFTINREIFRVEIKDREIWYGDRKWGRMIRLIPKDEGFIQKVKLSRNKLPHFLLNLFVLTEEEQKQYDEAKDDEALAQICIRDVRLKGGKLLKRDG